MRKIRFRSIIALLLFTTATTASANVIDMGLISDGTSKGLFTTVSPGGFNDTILFSVTETLLVSISVDSQDRAPDWEISDFLALSNNSDITFDFSPADNEYTFYGELPAGDYALDITGSGTGIFGGHYSAWFGGRATPLPAALWLFGAALLTLRLARK
jgi:hypothetical protein